MARIPTLLCVFVLLSLLTYGCQGSSGIVPDEDGQRDAPASDSFTASAGLPGFDGLPVPEHEASLIGPGWYEIAARDGFHLLHSAGAEGVPGGGLSLGLEAAASYALYGVRGFDGDNGPTSARITVDSIVGEYYVAFSDYTYQRWIHAGPFTDSAEAEIPNDGSYVSPRAFVSPRGVSYFALIVPAGSEVEYQLVELGVHGGALGPRPPRRLRYAGGEIPFAVAWEASLDAGDPDFAGYVLERAPLFYGDFAVISAPSVADQYYIDHDVELGELYRYRAVSVDVSGNRSPGASAFAAGGPMSGGQVDPVAILDLPRGPLLGPVEVTLDLSRSFDPEGGTIDTYEINTPGLGSLSGPSNLYNITLQPGCYVIHGTVKAGTRAGSTTRLLKIFPQWEENPSAVYLPTGSIPRLEHVRAGRLPSGKAVFIGFDATIPAFAVWSGDAATYRMHPVSGSGQTVTYISEPVALADRLAVCAVLGNAAVIVSYDDEDCIIIPSKEVLPGTPAVLVRLAGENLGVVYLQETAAIIDLLYQPLTVISTEVVQANVPAPISALDAIYNPATGAIDIVYDDAAGTQWRRYQPGVGVLNSELLSVLGLLAVDLELDPGTGRPVMVHHLATPPTVARYQALNADNATWSLAQDVDSSDINEFPADLVVDLSGTYVFNGLAGGGNPVYSLYERSAGLWSVVNTSSIEYQPYSNVALLIEPGSGDGLVIGHDAGGITALERLPSGGGAATLEWNLAAGSGQGREMHSARGTDGLHLIYRSQHLGQVRHFRSPTGDTWFYEGTPFGAGGAATDLDIGSNKPGEVYASYIDINSAELQYWNGANWVPQLAYPTLAGFRPFLSDEPTEDRIRWAVYIQPTGNVRFVDGSQTLPFSVTAVAPTVGPVWDGTIIRYRCFAVAGSTVNNSDIGWFTFGSGEFKREVRNNTGDGLAENWGRVLDSCTYNGAEDGISATWIPQGILTRIESVILEQGSLIDQRVVIRHDRETLDLLSSGYYRTVSMASAWGGTGLAIDCDTLGSDPVFAWSDYGDWELLDMPPGMDFERGEYFSKPELIVSSDGRWHMVYHDYLTDTIMVRSTL